MMVYYTFAVRVINLVYRNMIDILFNIPYIDF